MSITRSFLADASLHPSYDSGPNPGCNRLTCATASTQCYVIFEHSYATVVPSSEYLIDMADIDTTRLCVQIVHSHFGPLAAVCQSLGCFSQAYD